jgi:hypothetical protein
MKTIIAIMLTALLSISVYADYRIWKDKAGNTIEAELVVSTATQVVIRDREGRQMKFHPSRLSPADQKYLRTAFPPRMEIDFKKSQDRKKESYWSYSHLTMSGEIKITKKEQKPYDKSLKTVFMMIGESQRTSDLIILDRVEKTFDFKTSRETSLQGKSFTMFEDRYDNSIGVKYKGYLAVVLDDQDQVVLVKSSRKDFEEKVNFLLSCKHKDRFTSSFGKSSNSGGTISGGILYY